MLSWSRIALGWILFGLGAFLFNGAIVSRHNLPQMVGFIPRIKEIVIYKDANPLILGGDVGLLGPTTVTSRWYFKDPKNEKDDRNPSGDYQFKDDQGVVTVLKFCNSPAPDFSMGTKLKVEYIPKGKGESIKDSIQNEGCVLLTKATILEEAKK